MKNFRFILTSFLLVALMLVGLVGCDKDGGGSVIKAQDRLRIATTTSLYDTGLWNALEDRFEAEKGIRLDIVYAGTGIALEYGRRGDVDAVAVHAKGTEEQFIAEGYGIERIPFAYNYFVIVGPEGDPAGLAGLSPEDALKKLHDTQTTFVSRGDASGTHVKEQAIWKLAGFDYDEIMTSGSWYVEAGKGMGPTLQMASEMEGYTLSDIGTFLAYKSETGLVAIVDQGSILLNVYSFIVIDPDNVPGTKKERAQILADFLVSDEIQAFIGDYGKADYGASLFTPCAGNEPSS
jgi:tungstate transport system substrate-binding protein